MRAPNSPCTLPSPSRQLPSASRRRSVFAAADRSATPSAPATATAFAAASRPLSEGAVLKKKFDDIFAATKYTKALETIRKLKNEMASELKEKKGEHSLLKERTETAATLKKQVGHATEKKAEIEERIRAAQAREAELDEEMKALDATYNKIKNLADQMKARRRRDGGSPVGSFALLRLSPRSRCDFTQRRAAL